MPTIAHISDLHFGRIDPPVAEALANDLQQNPASVLVVSGDLTQRARPWQFEQARDYLARLPRPQVVIPGNHDVPLYDVIQRFLSPLRRYKRWISTDAQPVFRNDKLMVVGINTARSFSFRPNGFWKDGRIDDVQLDQLREQTRGLPDEVIRVVATHHPLISPTPALAGDIVGRVSRAVPVLRECKVDLVLAGHLHIGYCGTLAAIDATAGGGILSVQAGTATSTRSRENRNAYNLINIEKDFVSVQVRVFERNAFSEFVTTRFRRIDGVWRAQT